MSSYTNCAEVNPEHLHFFSYFLVGLLADTPSRPPQPWHCSLELHQVHQPRPIRAWDYSYEAVESADPNREGLQWHYPNAWTDDPR